MDNFLFLKDPDKKVYFDVVANELDVTPQLIEKDFWVCWILKILFPLPVSGNHLTLKEARRSQSVTMLSSGFPRMLMFQSKGLF